MIRLPHPKLCISLNFIYLHTLSLFSLVLDTVRLRRQRSCFRIFPPCAIPRFPCSISHTLPRPADRTRKSMGSMWHMRKFCSNRSRRYTVSERRRGVDGLVE
ncbi:hypothetical protein BS50DRAFT_11720 [Corynespora cassiicola Philippines]|uniref:Uncharacterized protein n=1 Tax=Corynespora cassiicola Philippines TaxID=1448308 RepID=A0A2T2P9B3_CORCC|nr:hypothetical protein BS50DRAFT_11720 [Corynespora cassiicola Philippines]